MLTLAIPVYNMQNLLDRCMEALLRQTSREFEILLIDDGSTDDSPSLCDAYAARYPDLVRVIHKHNGGLSSARNTGIDAAWGEFIIFPDPDDWVEPEYVQQLLELQRKGDTDLVCTGYYVDSGNNCVPGSPELPGQELTPREARKALLLEPRLSGFAWNKMYRLQIIRENELRFLDDVGITEDLDFVFRYLGRCGSVYHAPSVRTYHYWQRPDAATHSGFSVKKLDSLRTYGKIIDNSYEWAPELADAAREEICITAVNLLWDWERGDHLDKVSRAKLQHQIRKHLAVHLRSRRCDAGRKLQALTAAISPRLFALLKGAARSTGG